MAVYTLQVLNKSGFTKNYTICQQPPIVNANGGSIEVFSNAWVTFPGIRPGSFDKVVYNEETNAYWGTTTTRLENSASVTSGGFAPVNTATRDGVIFMGPPSLGFSAVKEGIAASGAFRIIANTDFKATNKFVFGMAKSANTPIPSPVATFLAMPNVTYDVVPVIKFYVSEGTYTFGELINVKSFSTQVMTVDFTGKAQTTVTVVHDDDGTFQVVYSN